MCPMLPYAARAELAKVRRCSSRTPRGSQRLGLDWCVSEHRPTGCRQTQLLRFADRARGQSQGGPRCIWFPSRATTHPRCSSEVSDSLPGDEIANGWCRTGSFERGAQRCAATANRTSRYMRTKPRSADRWIEIEAQTRRLRAGACRTASGVPQCSSDPAGWRTGSQLGQYVSPCAHLISINGFGRSTSTDRTPGS